MMPFTVVANTMQALVKYHGLKNWELRIPYHDSISVNTTSLYSEVKVTEGGEGRLLVAGRKNEDALRRIEHVSQRLAGKPFTELGLAIDSKNTPGVEGKGLGFSSSAGACGPRRSLEPPFRSRTHSPRCLSAMQTASAGQGSHGTLLERVAVHPSCRTSSTQGLGSTRRATGPSLPASDR